METVTNKMEVAEKIEKIGKTDEKNPAKEDAKDESICEHHADESLLEDQHEGTVVCSTCGVVVVEQLICGVSEWRTFGDDNQADIWERCRVGGVENRFLSSAANLATTIQSAQGKSRRGDTFNSTILHAVKRKSVDNGIWVGLKRLDEMADRIHLTRSVIEYAHYLYYKMYKRGKFKGIALATDSKVSACLYIACYHAQCPRTINEICGISENSHDSIQRAIKNITKLLNLPVGKIEYRDVMPRYCAWLLLPHQIERRSIRIAEKLEMLSGRKRYSVETIAGTAIYIATHQPTTPNKCKRTQEEIADLLGITASDIDECNHRVTSKK